MTPEIEQLRKASLESLYYFGKYVLGYTNAEDRPHAAMCKFISSPHKKKLLVGMRGVYKTSFGSVAYGLWILLHNPNARVLLVSNTIDNARLSVGEIKSHLENNVLLIAIMADQIPERRHGIAWSASALLLIRGRIFSEPSFTAAGVETQLARRHFTHIIGDDVVAARRDDMKEDGVIILNPEEVDKAIGWDRITRPGLSVKTQDEQDDTEVIYILNRWATYDFAAHIINNGLVGKDNPKGFEYMELGDHLKCGKLSWPNVMDEKRIAETRKNMGEFMYWTQQRCKPYNPKDRGFPETQNEYWEGTLPENHQDMKMYALMDLADSLRPDSCYTTFLLLLIDSNNHIWVVEAVRQRMDTNAKLELIGRMYVKYQFGTLHMEKNLHDDTMRFVLKAYKNQTGYTFSVRSLFHKNRNKDARILRLQPHHEQKAIHVKKSQKELLEEMRDYPRARYKDALDTLGYSMDFVRKPLVYRDETDKAPIALEPFTLTNIKKSIKKRKAAAYGGGLLRLQERRHVG